VTYWWYVTPSSRSTWQRFQSFWTMSLVEAMRARERTAKPRSFAG
jgi:hypothetical protein